MSCFLSSISGALTPRCSEQKKEYAFDIAFFAEVDTEVRIYPAHMLLPSS